ncbi:MAG: peptidoglycan DD-metalloendopeptidase family protein [Pseudomonadota bacterium]
MPVLRALRNACAVAALLVLLPVVPGASAADADAVQTAAELERILRELNDLSTWFGAADRKRIRLLAELKERDDRVADTIAAVRRARATVATAQAQLEALRAEEATLEDRRQVQAERIASQLRSAARLGSDDMLKQLLNQQAPDQLERMLRYHGHLSAARVAAVKAFEATLAELEVNARALETQREQAQRDEARLEARVAELEQERGQRQQLIADLDAEVVTKTEQRERLSADRTRLEALLVELRRRSTELDGDRFARQQGNLPWPIAGTLAHRYGSTRSDAELRWQGNRFAASAGVQVQAVYEGRVVFADWLRGYGQLLIVDHGGQFMTLYGSVDGLNKGVGDWVEGGEVIATAGTSGGQSTPGLYFEVRQNGKPQDPNRWLRQP